MERNKPTATRRLGSLEEASVAAGVSYRKLTSLDLPKVRVGRRVLVDMDELDARLRSKGGMR